MKEYRNNGAIGALLDEYERAIIELQKVIEEISPKELVKVVDDKTNDPDCKSIQTILSHVVRSGYGYAMEVRKSLNEQIDFPKGIMFNSINLYQEALDNMLKYNEELFKNYSNIKIVELDNKKKIVVRWGQYYDVEQLFEHAIVHILRHRRQIEKFLRVIQNG